jgi:tetratricopeptide (TPR) repeat protein
MLRRIFTLLALVSLLPWNASKGQTMVARDYFLMGAAKLKCNACTEAVEDFSKALGLHKSYDEAFYGRSLAYLCLSDYKSAIKDIDAAIRLKPQNPLYLECKGRIKAQSGDAKGSLKEFGEALKQDSTTWQAWYGLACASHATGDTSAARLAFDKTLYFNEKHAMAWFGRSKLNLECGSLNAALEDVNRALDLEPGYLPFRTGRSKIHCMRRDYDAAIQDAEAALKIDSKNFEAHFLTGEALRLQGQFFKADFAYAQASKLNKESFLPAYYQGVCRDSIKDYSGAKKFYGVAVSRKKTFQPAWVARARIWALEGKWKQQKNDLKAALALDNSDFDLWMELGAVNIKLESFDEASNAFKTASKKKPENPEPWIGLGDIKFAMGNLGGACRDWEKAAELGSDAASQKIQDHCLGK